MSAKNGIKLCRKCKDEFRVPHFSLSSAFSPSFRFLPPLLLLLARSNAKATQNASLQYLQSVGRFPLCFFSLRVSQSFPFLLSQ